MKQHSKRQAALLLAAGLSAALAGCALASELEPEMEIAAETFEAETASPSSQKEDSGIPGIVTGADIDNSVLIDYMARVLSVVESPEFQELTQYAQEHIEVQDLLNTLAGNLLTFIQTDRALADKIMETLGYPTIYLDAIVDGSRAMEFAASQMDTIMADPQMQTYVEQLRQIKSEGEVREYLTELAAAILGPAPGPATAAPEEASPETELFAGEEAMTGEESTQTNR